MTQHRPVPLEIRETREQAAVVAKMRSYRGRVVAAAVRAAQEAGHEGVVMLDLPTLQNAHAMLRCDDIEAEYHRRRREAHDQATKRRQQRSRLRTRLLE